MKRINKFIRQYKTLLILFGIFSLIGLYLALDTNFGFLASVIGEPVEINAIGGKKSCKEGCANGKYQYWNKNKDQCMAKASNKCKPAPQLISNPDPSPKGNAPTPSSSPKSSSSPKPSSSPSSNQSNSTSNSQTYTNPCGKVCAYQSPIYRDTGNCGSHSLEGQRQFEVDYGCGCTEKKWVNVSDGSCD